MQELTWVPEQGDWMLVVMNADGSAGISVESRIGATFPALDGLGWGLLIGGLVCLVLGALLLVLAARRPAERRGPAYPVAWPPSAGPSPAWPPSGGPQQSGTQPAGQQPAGPPSASSAPPWYPPAQADRTTATDSQPSPSRTQDQ